MIDFEIPEDTRAIRDKVRKFVQEECIPAESRCTADNFEEVRDELRGKARSQGLWCPFVPEEHGGMGLRPLAIRRRRTGRILSTISGGTHLPNEEGNASVLKLVQRTLGVHAGAGSATTHRSDGKATDGCLEPRGASAPMDRGCTAARRPSTQRGRFRNAAGEPVLSQPSCVRMRHGV